MDWRLVILDVIRKLAFEVEKMRPSPICPILFHLYQMLEFLRGKEMVAYKVVEVKFKYNITLELKCEAKKKTHFER